MSNVKTEKQIENVVIIGGGVAGLSAGIYLSRAGLAPLILAGSPPGGQLTLTSEVENYPGVDSILGPELIEKMRAQAKKFGARIIDENVIRVDFTKASRKTSAVFPLRSSTAEVRTRSVMIATGTKALWLGLASETRLRGRGVSACATCDGFFFRGKTVAVVGGGDTAMEEALTLTKFAKKVYLIHRRDSFRASKIMTDRVLKHPKIEVIYNAVVEEVLGEKKVEAIRLKSVKTGLNQLKLDGIFIAIGHKPDTELFSGQIEMDEKGYIITKERLALELAKIKNQKSKVKNNLKIDYLKLVENWKLNIENYKSITSVPGVFAAGDCVDYVYRQAATAAGMGVAAALEAEKYLEVIG